MRSSERNSCGGRARSRRSRWWRSAGSPLSARAEVYRAGADSLAVIRDLICAANPGERAREYLEVAASDQRIRCRQDAEEGDSPMADAKSPMATVDPIADRSPPDSFAGSGLFDSTTIVVGSMIGSGIFIVSADIGAQYRFDRRTAGRLDHHGIADRRGGAFLRRTGGDDAEGRRAIHLPARGVLSALGLFVRLDALPGDSDGNHCRGRGGLCAISGSGVAGNFSERVYCSSHRALGKICDQSFRAATGRAASDSFSDAAQHARIEAREIDSECVHLGENAGARRVDPGGSVRWDAMPRRFMPISAAFGRFTIRRPSSRARTG